MSQDTVQANANPQFYDNYPRSTFYLILTGSLIYVYSVWRIEPPHSFTNDIPNTIEWYSDLFHILKTTAYFIAYSVIVLAHRISYHKTTK